MFIKKVLPRTLFSRFFLIVIIPIVITQLIAVYIFYYTHWDDVSKHMARSLVREIEIAEHIISNSDNKEEISSNEVILLLSKYVDTKLVFHPGKKLEKKAKISDKNWQPSFFDKSIAVFDSLNRLKVELKNSFDVPFAVYIAPQKRLVVELEMPGGILEVIVNKKRIITSTTSVFILWIIGTTLLMTFISLKFIQNQIRPIKTLAKTAERFGRGQDVPNFSPRGAKEIRSAAFSFIKMKERISRQVNQRTEMLAGVSHDLRTPLTRMKLQLAMMGDKEETKYLRADVAEMEKMINEYLDFARGAEGEKSKKVNIKNFMRKIIREYNKSQKAKIRFEAKNADSINMSIKQMALKRAISNIIDNAVKYGTHCKITMNLSEDNSNVDIFIDDDGPGIPEKELQNIFKPFYRTDSARNLDNGGVGLGLSISQDVIYSHGGDIYMEKSPMGGLRVIIKLPF